MRRNLDDYDLMNAMRLDGAAGPAVPIDDARAAAIVGGALDRVFAPGGGGGGAAGSAAGGGFGAKMMAGALAAAALAGTAWWLLRPEEPIPAAASVPMPVVAAAPAPVVEPLPPPVPEEAPVVVIPVPAPEAEHPEHEQKPDKPKIEAKQKSVDDLMAEANAARKARKWKKADALYLEVVHDHAQSPSAQVALVASATLHLEHLGDPRGAMQRFRAAIGRVSGPLAEEARYGLAEAHRALGDKRAEQKALDEFLEHHADSPLAERARERRDELK